MSGKEATNGISRRKKLLPFSKFAFCFLFGFTAGNLLQKQHWIHWILKRKMSSENLAFCEMLWGLQWAAAGCWWHKMHKSQVLPLLCLYWLAQTIDSKNQTIGIFQGWHPTKLLLKHSHIEDSGKPTPIQRVTLDDKKRVTFPPVGSLFHPFTISRTLSLQKVETWQ